MKEIKELLKIMFPERIYAYNDLDIQYIKIINCFFNNLQKLSIKTQVFTKIEAYYVCVTSLKLKRQFVCVGIICFYCLAT